MKSTDQIKVIVKDGGSVIIDSSKSTAQLKSIVKVAQENVQVTIRKAGEKSIAQLKSIAKVANCTVIFDLLD